MSTLQVSTVLADVVTSTLTVAAGTASGNTVTASGSTAGSPVTLSATGVDTNININLIPKGTGTLQVNGTAVGGVSKLSLFYFSNRN